MRLLPLLARPFGSASGIALGAALLGLLAGGGARAAAPKGDSLVHARLIADAATIEPGKPFTLGVLLTVEPGWHIYWRNPGDSGLATRVRFAAPKGYVVGELTWPTPSKFVDPGNDVMYGYEGSVLLSAIVTAPADAPVGARADFSAKVSWLCCQKMCLPGKAGPTLALPIASARQGDNASVFNEWLPRIPVELGSPGAIAKGNFHVERSGDWWVCSAELHWNAEPAAVEFFPATPDELQLTGLSVKTDGKTTGVRFKVRVRQGETFPGRALLTIVAARVPGGDWRGLRVHYPLG